MATKSSPGTTVRELIETPANRARGSTPRGAATPNAPATSSTVHCIASSRGWVALVSDHPWISVPDFKRARSVPHHWWHRLQSVGSGSCKDQAPQTEVCATLIPVSPLAQDTARHFTVVKLNRAVAQNLIRLMPFPGQQH